MAVKVTGCPTTDGSGADVTVVVVAAGATVCVSVPTEPVKLPSPLYVAVTMYTPAVTSPLVVTLVVPPLSVPASVTVVTPSVATNVTVPVGVPAPGETGATVAVKVTGCPTTDGSGADETVVVVAAGATVCVSVPTEVVKSPSPL